MGSLVLTAEAVASTVTVTPVEVDFAEIASNVGNIFQIATSGFNFIVENPLCMFMVAISFAGVALGLVKRAFKTARK